ncbi:SH3 domain-containing protein [Histidinibacterium lentulum]|uniref:SH3b domain-containing protein n=1 Tax=Histidinibacterium lentulum TaxID=2480588 RepID=A0A3N2R5N8_9RHOB|nr:SH3 domain-containing protein [Histidinibacterium lentulum]ROU02681.1 hypothetical protein EAT49_10185 [Histidinibacterium lentulum]
MKRFILLTFALLAWTFWEMSGGADFVPETRPGADRIAATVPAPDPLPAAEATEPAPAVTRAASLPLISPRPASPAGPSGPAGPQPAGVTQARFLTPPDGSAPGDDGAVRWTSAADALAEAVAIETAVRAAQAAPAPAPEGVVSVNGSLVNVRTGPGTDFEVLATLPRGTEVDLVELRGGWAMIRLSSGEEGWMAEYLLDGL